MGPGGPVFWRGLGCVPWTALFLLSTPVRGSDFDYIGVTVLRATTTNLDGTGVRVAQVEGGAPLWEVNPGAAGLSPSVFTWRAAGGSTNAFPNSLGSDSQHADYVASLFYGLTGVITNPAQVDNLEASFFAQVLLPSLAAIQDVVVNQSFEIDGLTLSQQQDFDLVYDGYAAKRNTLFVTGAGSGGTVGAPATCYNGIGVGAYDDPAGDTGPTLDNGRAKPDLCTLGGAGSFAAPLVSGAAAILIQAGLRGDGGPDTNAAVDMRTVKALLINGAVKPLTGRIPARLRLIRVTARASSTSLIRIANSRPGSRHSSPEAVFRRVAGIRLRVHPAI